VGPDPGSSLFASSTTLFDTILQKINFFKILQTDFSWQPFRIPGCNGLKDVRVIEELECFSRTGGAHSQVED